MQTTLFRSLRFSLLALFSLNLAPVYAADAQQGPNMHELVIKAAPMPPDSYPQELATVRSDRDATISHLSIVMDSIDQVEGISFKSENPSTPSIAGSDYYFSLNEIASSQGVVLITSGNYKAVLLKGAIGATEGKMVVSYLYNGLANQYKTCNVNIELNGSHWELVNAYTGAVIKDIMVKTYSFGIHSIENVCP